MPRGFFIPQGYRPILDLYETEHAIAKIKDFFQLNLALELDLTRMTAPLFVLKGTGVNDDLNGVERPVAFKIRHLKDQEAEVVQSLAKWKRMALADYKVPIGSGIYTDMNAIRSDETLDNLHSLYVDQWDWEKVITAEQRTLTYLQRIVQTIYDVIRRTELYVYHEYPEIKPVLPEEITFIHSEELLKRYPTLTPQEREDAIVREYKAVFIIGIGGKLTDGTKHDGRAPDYDDWTLNGDIFVWNPVTECAFELSSMGIRVDKAALDKQLKLSGQEQRLKLKFHQRLMNDELPLSIGGGIGQSRLCMLYLRKAHVGEIQASIWPEEMIAECKQNNIVLL
ncbi:MAG: aspartate--ammonia ligase [Ignavibacteriales bacterium]|nr:aspartate--ammonia ligase [Ignavibacteriales bacterium]